MATATRSDRIYQPSDLNRCYRAVLDEARAHRARVRDTDGLALLVIREDVVASVEAVTDAIASYLVVESNVAHGEGGKHAISDFGAWPWLRVFDQEDLEDFVAEMRDVLVRAAHERSARTVNETLEAWYNTALSLEDDVRRQILLGGASDDDFVEVSRPEAPDNQDD